MYKLSVTTGVTSEVSFSEELALHNGEYRFYKYFFVSSLSVVYIELNSSLFAWLTLFIRIQWLHLVSLAGIGQVPSLNCSFQYRHLHQKGLICMEQFSTNTFDCKEKSGFKIDSNT